MRKIEYKSKIKINIQSYILYTQAESQRERLQFSEHADKYWLVSDLLDARTRPVGKSKPQLLRDYQCLIYDQN